MIAPATAAVLPPLFPLVNRTTISFVVRSQVLAREGRELQTGEAREGERDGGGGGAGAARRREWWREG